MPDAKFFHQLKPIKARIGMKAPKRDKKDKGILPITFRMGLDGNIVRSGPDVVKRAYHEIEDGASVSSELAKIVEGASIQVYDTDTSRKPSFPLENVTLEKLVVQQTENSEGDKAVVLCFELEYPAEAEVWQKMRIYFKRDVWLVFDSEQASLLDAPAEEEEKKEESKQIELVPGATKRTKKDGKAAAAGEGIEAQQSASE
jgi:hypothetical protein